VTASVVIIGGGYGGISVAKALDDAVDVVLVDPKDSFVHSVAALRSLVSKEWAERMFFRGRLSGCYYCGRPAYRRRLRRLGQRVGIPVSGEDGR
jgi:flavin-dependent dehydrogenase